MMGNWMEKAQDVGLIGPASLRFHTEHAQGFADSPCVRELLASETCLALDLGSGGGLPGLVLATDFPSSTWRLLDARQRSQEHLSLAIEDETFAGRVSVVGGRGEELGRLADLREQQDLVTARGFAKPAVTAEIGSAFLRVGGVLVVSEPPDGGDARWPADGLNLVSLRLEDAWNGAEGHYRAFRKTEPLDSRYPRRVGVPEKRLLFS